MRLRSSDWLVDRPKLTTPLQPGHTVVLYQLLEARWPSVLTWVSGSLLLCFMSASMCSPVSWVHEAITTILFFSSSIVSCPCNINPPLAVAATCSDNLPIPTNGTIAYTGGSTNNRPVGATASYTCTTGYTLSGDTTRTCGIDGVWSGSTPTCQSKWNELCIVCLFSISSPIQVTALSYPHWWMGWLCTVVDPLTSHLSSLVLCTPVTLATLSLEVLSLKAPPGPVWVEGDGMGHLQLVKVSS